MNDEDLSKELLEVLLELNRGSCGVMVTMSKVKGICKKYIKEQRYLEHDEKKVYPQLFSGKRTRHTKNMSTYYKMCLEAGEISGIPILSELFHKVMESNNDSIFYSLTRLINFYTKWPAPSNLHEYVLVYIMATNYNKKWDSEAEKWIK